jgi:hypothetical protein
LRVNSTLVELEYVRKAVVVGADCRVAARPPTVIVATLLLIPPIRHPVPFSPSLTDNPHVRAACKALISSMSVGKGIRMLTLVNCHLTPVEAFHLAEYLRAEDCALEQLE